MGIHITEAVGIASNCQKRGLGGRVLTLGKQDCHFTVMELIHSLARAGLLPFDGKVATISLKQKAVLEEFEANGRLLHREPEAAAKGHVTDEFFFRFIGFDSVVSTDYGTAGGAYEGASVAFDLNEPGLADVVGQHDLVYDGGMIEHIFHVPNMFRNIFESLAVGGFVFHNTPTNNMVDHGFYQFSPTFFHDYYAANGYGEVEIYLTRLFLGPFASKAASEVFFHEGNWAQTIRYQSGMLGEMSNGGLDAGIYHTRCYARKLADSTYHRNPQQAVYVPKWDAFAT